GPAPSRPRPDLRRSPPAEPARRSRPAEPARPEGPHPRPDPRRGRDRAVAPPVPPVGHRRRAAALPDLAADRRLSAAPLGRVAQDSTAAISPVAVVRTRATTQTTATHQASGLRCFIDGSSSGSGGRVTRPVTGASLSPAAERGATVDDDDLTGDPRREVRREEQHRVRD